MAEPLYPVLVLLFSGKRKCGKDFLTEALLKRLGENRAQIVHISEPIKRSWAEKLGLDLKELLGDGPYKERYRKEMIDWSDEMRRKDYGFFCREATRHVTKEICIISDIRRKTDIRYFLERYGEEKVRTVRIVATEDTRKARGWQFTAGVDDVQSECDLDDVTDWHLVIENDGTDLETMVSQLEHRCS